MTPTRMLEQVRARAACCAPGTPLVAMLSGGRDSVCLLDLAVAAARARGGHRAARQLRAARRLRRGRGATARRSASGSGCALEVERPRRPEGPGNLQAWARDARYAAAARLADGAGGARSPPATPPTTRSRRSSTGSPPRRAAAPCSGCAPATAAWCGRCSASPGRRRPPTARSAASPGATTRATSEPTYARNRVRHGLLPALAEVHPAAAAQRPAHGRAAARRGRGARRARRRRARRLAATRRAATIALERLAELPPALRRLVVQRLADRAAGRPVAGAARHAERGRGAAPHRHRMLDLGGGVRAVVERGVLRAERGQPSAAHI